MSPPPITEAECMVAIERSIDGLPLEARSRVLTWAMSRWAPEMLYAVARQSAQHPPDPIGFPEPVYPTIQGFPVTSGLPFDRVTRANRPLEDGLLPRAGAFAAQPTDINADGLAEDDTDGGVALLKNAERALTQIAERITDKSDPTVVASDIVKALGRPMASYVVRAFSSEVLCYSSDYHGSFPPFIYTEAGKAFAAAIWDELGRMLVIVVEPPAENATPRYDQVRSGSEEALDVAEAVAEEEPKPK